MSKIIIKARPVSKGVVEGKAMISKCRISFWGGADVKEGLLTERNSPLEGRSFKDKVLIFQSSKGSSGTSWMLKMSKINGMAPKAFVTTELDCLTALGCVVCEFPMVTEPEEDVFQIIQDGDWVKVDADNGIIEVTKAEEN